VRKITVSLVFSLVFAASGSAWAGSHRDLAYTSNQTWTSAVRLLRLDLGFDLSERDRDAGYVVFTYIEGEQSHTARLELIERTLTDGRQGVRVVVTVPSLPTYVELHLLDRLERKLRDEVGEPPPRPSRRRAASRRSSERDDEDSERESDDDEDDDQESEDDD